MQNNQAKIPLYVKRAKQTRTNYKGFCKALLALLVWGALLLPLTLVYKFFEWLLIKIGLKKKLRDPSPPEIDTSVLEKTETPKDKREFDLVVFGATGYTGNMLAEYLARNYKFVAGEPPKSRDNNEVGGIFLN